MRDPVIKVSEPIYRGAIHIAIEPDQGEPLCSQLWQRLAEQPLQEYDLMVELFRDGELMKLEQPIPLVSGMALNVWSRQSFKAVRHKDFSVCYLTRLEWLE